MAITGGTSSVTLYIPIGAPISKSVVITLPLRSESINPRYNQVTNSEALLGKRAPVGTFVGQLSYEGSIELELFDLTAATYKHVLFGALLYTIFGAYDDTTKKITLNNTSAVKLDAIKVVHGSDAPIYFKDAYVTSLRASFTTDGIPTVTLDVRAKSKDTAFTPPSGLLDYTSISYTVPYNAKNYAFSVGATNVSSKVSRFEITLPQEVIDYYTFGSLNAADLQASRLNMAEITIEYYPNAVSTIDLDAALETAFLNGAPIDATKDLKFELDSPMLTSNKLSISVDSAYVTEYTHDVNGVEYITSSLTIQASPANIEIAGVDLNNAA